MSINAGAVVSYLELDTGRFKSSLKSAGADLARFADSSESVSTRIGSLGSAFKTAGASLSVGLTVPLVGAGAAMAKFAGDFEESSNKVSTIADTSAVSMEELNKGVLNISNATGESASALNEALYQTLSATNDTANSLEYLEIASKAAGGGFTTTETAVDGLTSVMNAYGMKGKEAMQKVSDMMLQTQNAGKTTFGELSQSLYNVIPTAAGLGVKFEDVSAAMATITSQGTPTSVATTQLRQLFVELSKAGGDTSKAFKKVSGKSFKEFIAEGGNVQDALKLMEKAAKNNGVELKDMFGSVEAGNAAMQLTGNGAKKFKESLEQMENSAGATEEAFDKMDKGMNDGIGDMLNSLRNLAISFGQLLAPTINVLVGYIQNLIEWLQGLDENQKKMIVTVGLVVAAIGPALLVLGNLAGSIANVINIGKLLVNNWGLISSTATKLVGFLPKAFSMMFSPWGIAIMAAIAAGVLIYKHWDEIKAAAQSLWNNIRISFENIKTTISTKWKESVDFIKSIDLFQMGKDVVQGLINGISSKISGVVNKAKELSNKVSSTIKKALDINSPSRVTTMYGEFVAEGLAEGMNKKKKKVKKSSVDLAKVITDSLGKVQNYVNKTVSIIEKKFDLWVSKNKKLKGSSEYLSKQLEVQKEKHKGLTKEIEVTEKAIGQITAKYGENSIQVLELKNKLLDLQIAQQNVNNSMEETKKKVDQATDSWKKYYKEVSKGVYDTSSSSRSSGGGSSRKSKSKSYYNSNTGEHHIYKGGKHTVISDSGKTRDATNDSPGGGSHKGKDGHYYDKTGFRVKHDGGPVKDSGNIRSFNPFTTLKQFVSSLKPDEVPAILQEDEFVLSKDMIDSLKVAMDCATSLKLPTPMGNLNLSIDIDYEKLANAIASKVKPSVTQHNTFQSPESLNERTIRKNQTVLLRNIGLEWGI